MPKGLTIHQINLNTKKKGNFPFEINTLTISPMIKSSNRGQFQYALKKVEVESCRSLVVNTKHLETT